jgi:deoxyribonuclease IV
MSVTEESQPASKWRVGVHTSIAGSLDQAAERARQIGCTAFQIFSSSPRMWKSRYPRPDEIGAIRRLRQAYDLRPLVIHANYLINLASPEANLRQQSMEAFQGEVARAAALGAEYLVLHPGSHRNTSPEQGIRRLAASVVESGRKVDFGGVTLLMENTCGQGDTIGCSFEQLRDILAQLDGVPAGCCIDTAHCYAAGMDVSTSAGLDKTVSSLKRHVGLRRVKVIHTNDSRSALGSKRDRHEHIGKGGIGLEGFRRIVNHPALRHKAFILETPIDEPGDDRRNVDAIRALRCESTEISNLIRSRNGRTARTQSPVRARGHSEDQIPQRELRRGKVNR